MNVWIVTSVLDELGEHVVYGVWSTRDAALTAMGQCEDEAATVRCYLSHSVVDEPDQF